MSVMDKYVPRTSPHWERRLVPLPASSGLGQMPSLELFEAAPETLGMPFIGVYTEWATRTGDLSWEALDAAPDTNLGVWALTDRQINQATDLAFGNPLPFVAIMTPQPMSTKAIEQMWRGTAFVPYETLAVYRQDDAKAVPTIRFLHWGQRVDMADAPQHLLPAESAATQYGGQLVFAAQRGARDTTQRDFPAYPFADALSAQLALAEPSAMPGPPSAPPPQVIEQTTVASAPASFWQRSSTPIVVGVGAAALAYYLATRKRAS